MTTDYLRPMNETLEIALAVLERGWATPNDLRRAQAWRNAAGPKLGTLAMRRGQLTMDHVFEILGEQAISGGLFGEIAVQLGHLDKGDLHELLELQATQVPTLMDALTALSLITSKQADELHQALREKASDRIAVGLAT